jgi:hypothetical protein
MLRQLYPGTIDLILNTSIMVSYRKEARYVIHNCDYFDCTLVIRVGVVVHNGRVYSHTARYRRYCDYFASHQRTEALITTN